MQILRELLAAGVNLGGQRSHPFVQNSQKGDIGPHVLEHFVALLQKTGITLDGGKILRIHLGKDGIGKTAPFFAGFAYQGCVSGRNHDNRQYTNMFSQTSVGLIVPYEFLLPFLHLDGKTGLQPVLHAISAANGKTIRSIAEIVLVGGWESALGHGQIVDGIQQIGLPFPVVSADAVDVGREGEFLKFDVSEITDYYFLEIRHDRACNTIANI